MGVVGPVGSIFAACTSILAKIGMEGVNSNLATALRTTVVGDGVGGVFATGKQHEMGQIGGKSWIFLILSGIATGLSWIFFFYALQIGDASKVVPVDKFSVVITMILAFVVLGEPVTPKTILGGLAIALGTLILAL